MSFGQIGEVTRYELNQINSNLQDSYKDKTQQKSNFEKTPPFLPFQFKQVLDSQAIKDLQNSIKIGNNRFLDYLQPLSIGKLKYSKPVAIIYNPNSGKKKDIKKYIMDKFNRNNIKFEILESKKAFDTFTIPFKIDIENYSAIVAVGGDGTFHEVVNGMLNRVDKQKLPIAFVGNGSGNDTLRQFGVLDIDQALNFIVKGDLLKYDVVKILIDYQNEKDIPDNALYNHHRYSIINTVIGLMAKINHNAQNYKQWPLINPYQISAFVELTRLKPDKISLEVDGKTVQEDLDTLVLGVNNSKYGGSGMVLSPYSFMNDGMQDAYVHTQMLGVLKILDLIDQLNKYQGMHVYEKDAKFYRGKNIKVYNRSEKVYSWQSHKFERQLQRIAIDGENFAYKDFVQYETLPGEIDVIVDYEFLLKKFEWFSPKL
ncbi:diacylglycerol kinase [Stylonychia lemnae]|uniref:Diacylglycerol kinase n=1 Tax=Stylonychia lemnae TaxID=5949 RepID=A0A077ZPJ3_STYLE|nr:diacylglycerol kinase [Stylonychia lemnae]|eukprot:CDW71902.1 diacylglycerol kinase [Stylonychia lemnae]